MTVDLPEFPTMSEMGGGGEDTIPDQWQGKRVDSKQEWWIIQYLLGTGFDFRFQVPLFGGYKRGGYIVDFWIDFAPQDIVIEYYGNFWHEGAKGADDRLREQIIEHKTGVQVKGIYQHQADSKAAIHTRLKDILR